MSEMWLPVQDWPYEVSSLGRVLSTRTGKLMSLYKMPNGYMQATLSFQGNHKKVYVHRLVADAFHGARPSESHEIAHGDGNRENNRSDNLRWATRSENHLDKRKHGTMLLGERHNMAKLTVSEVLEIRRRYASGEMQKNLAVEFGMSKMAISRAVRGENWSHIK